MIGIWYTLSTSVLRIYIGIGLNIIACSMNKNEAVGLLLMIAIIFFHWFILLVVLAVIFELFHIGNIAAVSIALTCVSLVVMTIGQPMRKWK